MKRALFVFLLAGMMIGPLPLRSHAAAPPGRVVDLKPFATKSQFDYIGTPWATPKTSLAVDGVPFQIDGIVELFGAGSGRSGNGGPRKVEGLPVNGAFAELHFLGATAWSDPDSTVIARAVLNYDDGTKAELPIAYGLHVRDWFVPRREPAKPMLAAGVAEALRGECPESARYDKHYRFTRFILQNPQPTKRVKTIDLVSAERQSSLMVAALSLSETSVAAKGTVEPAIAKEALPNGSARSGAKAVLRGRVLSEAGEPLAGAEVRIIGVRNVGTEENDAIGDHPSLGMRTLTGEDGTFELKDLTDDRLYRVSAAKRGFNTAAYRGADTLGARPEIRLSSPTLSSGPSAKFKVLDQEGKPVSGAMLRINSYSVNSGTTFGGSSGFASLTLTDADGEATLSRKDAFNAVQVNVSAAGFAPAKARSYSTGGVEVVKIGPGSTLTGRVLKEGKPVGGRLIGLVGSERSSEVFVGYFEERTDADGRFTFRNVPPTTSFNLYGDLDSFQGIGLFGPQVVLSAKHGQTNDLGNTPVAEGLSLSGRLARTDGQSNPPTLRVRFYHESLWKPLAATVDAAGHFEMKHLPSGVVTLYLSDQTKFRLNLANRSLADYNSDGLEGVFTSSKDDLLILVEDRPKGSQQFSSSMTSLPQGDASRSRPLMGAEESGPANVVVAGSVVDDKSGQPVTRYRIVPGRALGVFGGPLGAKPASPGLAATLLGKRAPDPFRFRWMESRFIESTNSDWKISLASLSSPPVVRIEADGFDAYETDPLPNGTNGLVVRLRRGLGPNGIVVGTDGKPASGVLMFLAAGGDQMALYPDGRLYAYGNPRWFITNKTDGSFSFTPRKGARKLFASAPAGWAEVPESDLETGMTVRLKPWAAVAGILVDSNGVAQPNVELSLNMDTKAISAGDPFINLQIRLATDSQGRFLFTNVPPSFLHLNRNIPFGAGGGWTHSLQTYVDPSAGKTNDLGKLVRDRPPSKPLMDQLKEKIGL